MKIIKPQRRFEKNILSGAYRSYAELIDKDFL